MTADRTPLERLRVGEWIWTDDKGNVVLPIGIFYALLDRAGLCGVCGGTGERRYKVNIDGWLGENKRRCECVTRLNEAIEREIGGSS